MKGMNRRHLLVAAGLLSLAPALAFAQPKAGPLEVVRGIFAKGNAGEAVPLSKRLKNLENRAQQRSRQVEGVVEGLDFVPAFAGQDIQDGWEKTLSLKAGKEEPTRASVRVKLINFAPVELVYSMVNEAGAWRVDDITSVRKPVWVWSKMLERGARTPK